ncbi:protein NODULATION SIGNALING PATHWAY 2-like [Mangifera indica]|uniref:protein NODULATION SIGNALING PATHWAY 2-like n=1 Tax=Mangifera indica TaxID=29780 RepID=UPI001CF9B1E9|nr:protein NODULATION SIGNALING PATHWAY 2-like [Mangifera indica]
MIQPVHPFQDLYANNGVAMEDDLLFMNYFESSTFSPPFTTISDNLAPSAMSNDFIDIDNFPFHVNEMQITFPVDDSSSVLDLEDLDLDPNLNIDLEEIRDWLENGDHDQESDDSSYQQLSMGQEGNETSMEETSIIPEPILNFPTEGMEINNELCASHLAKAYGEAMANEHRELAEVIVKRINAKVSPVGGIKERLLYHSFQPLNKETHDNYLKQESCKVFDAAFKAFYSVFPNGMFAHFTANSAILEAVPHDTEVLHIVDFDMGEGVQWASMIVALAQRQNLLQQFGLISQQITFKLTSIKWKNAGCICGQAHPHWRFEETKKQLIYYANCHGIKLKVEEMELQDLVHEIKKTKRRGGRREWMAFNCMWALPHMGRRRRRGHVMEFLKLAKDFLANCENNDGIITFGDGDTWEKTEDYSCFESFFESYQEHYQALLESMEWNLHNLLAEARIAMECLFVAPYASCLSLFEKWKEIKEVCEFEPGFGLKGVRLSSESLMEAKVMGREGEGLYRVRIEGENANEMVLEWERTPLVRVSAWRL